MSRKPEALPDKRRTRIKAAIDLYNSGRRSDAAKELLKCLRLFDEEERNTREYAAFCCNLGAALAESGELGAAIRFFRAALAIYDKRRETLDSALVHFNLGNVYKYANNWQASVHHYETALDIFHKVGDRSREAACVIALGHFFVQLDVVEEVKRRLSRIWSLRRSLTDEGRWSFYMLLSDYASMTERKHKALSFANRALAWAEKTGNQAYVRTTHGIRARLISELGNISAGAELAEQVHVRSRSDRGRLDRSFSLALMHADAGNLPRALVLLRECLDEVHTRRLQLPANQRYLFMERYAEIGRKYVYYLAKQGDWRSAFEVSEEVQARTVLDLMFRHQIKRQQGRTITSGPNGRLHLNTAGCETVAEFLSQHSACMLKFFFPHKDLLIGWVMTPDGAVLGWDASAGIPHLREARGKLPVSHYVEFATNVKIKEGMIEVCPPPMTRASRGSSFVDWDGALRDLSGFYEKAICDCARTGPSGTRGQSCHRSAHGA